MTKWEYKQVTTVYMSMIELTELGQQGWELCSILSSKFTPNPTFHFKRPIIKN